MESFHPIQEIRRIFTYNEIALISLQSSYSVKASMILMRAHHLFIHNYIRSLLNNILRRILRPILSNQLMVQKRLEHSSYCLCV